LRVRPNGSVEAKALWQKTARAREDAAHSFVLGAPRVELVRTIMNECAQTMWLRGRHDGFGRCLALPISAGWPSANANRAIPRARTRAYWSGYYECL